MFDEVVVAVGINQDKRGFFDMDKRLSIIYQATEGMKGVSVIKYENLTIDTGAPDRPLYILNGTFADSLPVDFRTAPVQVEIYDTFGSLVATPVCRQGLMRLPVPASGSVKIRWPGETDPQRAEDGGFSGK